jgi:hypothetical protein
MDSYTSVRLVTLRHGTTRWFSREHSAIKVTSSTFLEPPYCDECEWPCAPIARRAPWRFNAGARAAGAQVTGPLLAATIVPTSIMIMIRQCVSRCLGTAATGSVQYS